MSAHDDYLDPDKHLWNDEPPEWWDTMEQNCKEILSEFDCKNWGELYRIVYKYTDCGPSLGIICSYQDKPVYCDELYRFDKTQPVLQIYVSSIVEGLDICTSTHVVDMKIPGANERLMDAIEAVNNEAIELWNEANP